jgi:RNA polymerase sigma-70 factor (ECF subfamily)
MNAYLKAADSAAPLSPIAGMESVPTVPERDNLSVEPAAAESLDDALIERTLGGDEGAFEQLVARHGRRVFAIARHFFRSPETVEDIAQETFAKAFFSLASYRRGASFEQWLAKIAVNNCYDELRRRKKRGEWRLADLTEDEGSWLEGKLSRVSFEIHLGDAERERAAEVAEKLLDALEAPDRLILMLLHAEECSVREIAGLLGWSEAKVKIRAFRARLACRRALDRLTRVEQRKSKKGVTLTVAP